MRSSNRFGSDQIFVRNKHFGSCSDRPKCARVNSFKLSHSLPSLTISLQFFVRRCCSKQGLNVLGGTLALNSHAPAQNAEQSPLRESSVVPLRSQFVTSIRNEICATATMNGSDCRWRKQFGLVLGFLLHKFWWDISAEMKSSISL